jgi:hypothetical protein
MRTFPLRERNHPRNPTQLRGQKILLPIRHRQRPLPSGSSTSSQSNPCQIHHTWTANRARDHRCVPLVLSDRRDLAAQALQRGEPPWDQSPRRSDVNTSTLSDNFGSFATRNLSTQGRTLLRCEVRGLREPHRRLLTHGTPGRVAHKLSDLTLMVRHLTACHLRGCAGKS